MPPLKAGTVLPGATLVCGERELDLSRTVIVGILNVTPDSFADGGRYRTRSAALRHAESMQSQGAEIIDVGGESTRPGSIAVTVDEELERTIPVIEDLSKNIDAVISVDTSKPEVMRQAVAAGAGMINDVNALRAEQAVSAAAQTGVPVCLMHMRGEPRTMQHNPMYDNVVVEVRDYLYDRASRCVAAGIQPERILIDPGFGFGKTVVHNLELLRNLGRLGAEYPVLAGLSGKSMIGALLALPVGRRVNASVALAMIAVMNGARLLRVHDVGPTREAIRLFECVYPRQANITPTQGAAID